MKNIKTYEQYYKGQTFKEFLDKTVISKGNHINCEGSHLIDLIGIEKFTNTTAIHCASNYLTSLEPIKNLTNLMLLSCYNNKITSLKGIENLNKLESLYCDKNPIDWVDYIDKEGRTYYIKLPKSISWLDSDKFNGSNTDKFENIEKYWKWFDENQPVSVSRKFNF